MDYSPDEVFTKIEAQVDEWPENPSLYYSFKPYDKLLREKIGRPFNQAIRRFMDEAMDSVYPEAFALLKGKCNDLQKEIDTKEEIFYSNRAKGYSETLLEETRVKINDIEERILSITSASESISKCNIDIPPEIETALNTYRKELEEAEHLRDDIQNNYLDLRKVIDSLEKTLISKKALLRSDKRFDVIRQMALDLYYQKMDSFVEGKWKDLALKIIEKYNAIPKREINSREDIEDDTEGEDGYGDAESRDEENIIYSLDEYQRKKNKGTDELDKYYIIRRTDWDDCSPPVFQITQRVEYHLWD